ncbi:MAG: IS982 family transposase [Anaerolineales bacterium]|nr:IS982 family transposase [Anaerolineales bacterium]
MDATIVAVYAICDDVLKGLHHHEDPQVEMTDAEIMTTGIVAALFFGGHYKNACEMLSEQGYMPSMLSKSRFSRRLHWIKSVFLQLFAIFGEHWKCLNKGAVYSIDTFPIPMCDNYRIPRARLYHGEDYRGYIASKKQYYYGLKIHLMATEHGHPIEFFLTPGAFADVTRLQYFDFDLPTGSKVVADRIYNDYEIEDILKDVEITFWPMRKRNSKRQFPPWVQYLQHVYRKMIETTGSLLSQLLPKRIHAVTSGGFELKVVLFLLAVSFNFCK